VANSLLPTSRSCESHTIDELVQSDKPILLKGFVSHWPLVKLAVESGVDVALDSLAHQYNGQPVLAFVSDVPAARFFL
jgi:hypothetical protein